MPLRRDFESVVAGEIIHFHGGYIYVYHISHNLIKSVVSIALLAQYQFCLHLMPHHVSFRVHTHTFENVNSQLSKCLKLGGRYSGSSILQALVTSTSSVITFLEPFIDRNHSYNRPTFPACSCFFQCWCNIVKITLVFYHIQMI